MGDLYSGPSSRSSTRQNGDSDSSDPAEWARSQPTLREQLHDSLRLYRLDDRDRAVARFIIEALDDDLAGLVVRVDSPGGSVLASEEIRRAILRHKAKGMPVAV